MSLADLASKLVKGAVSLIDGKKDDRDAGNETSGATESTETAFSEALVSKSGGRAVEILKSAQPEDLKSIAQNKAMITQIGELDSASSSACMLALSSYLPKKSGSGKKDDKKSGSGLLNWGKSLLSKGSDLLSDAGDALSSLGGKISDGWQEVTSTVSEGWDSLVSWGSEKVSDVKELVTMFREDPQQTAEDLVTGFSQSEGWQSFSTSQAGRSIIGQAYNIATIASTPGKKRQEMIDSNRENNSAILNSDSSPLLTTLGKDSEFIEHQNSDWSGVKYGSSTMKDSGCGLIATYNALVALGEHPTGDTMVEIISNYEKDGMVLNGKAGTSPNAIQRYFEKTGHSTSMVSNINSMTMQTLSDKYETFIVVGLNNNADLMYGGHYVSVTKQENTKEEGAGSMTYVVHNGNNIAGGYPTLYQAVMCGISDSDPNPFRVIGVSKPAEVVDLPSSNALGTGLKNLGSSFFEMTGDFIVDAKTNGKSISDNILGYIDALENWGKGAIPQNVPNEVIVDFYSIASDMKTPGLTSKFKDSKLFGPLYKALNFGTNSLSSDLIEQHYEKNSSKLSSTSVAINPKLNNTGDYIENQAQWGGISYGMGREEESFGDPSNMSYSGCEIIATYNALIALGEKPDMALLIKGYEKHGMTLNGHAGTAPTAIMDYFAMQGFDTRMLIDFSNDSAIEALAQYDTIIATVYNDENDITNMIHTVSITKEVADGKTVFRVHNSYNTKPTAEDQKVLDGMTDKEKERIMYFQSKGYASLKEAAFNLSGASTKPISLIGINKKLNTP